MTTHFEQDVRTFAAGVRAALEPGLEHDAAGMPIAEGACLYASLTLAAVLRKFAKARVTIRGGDGLTGSGAQDKDGHWQGHYWLEVGPNRDGQILVADITGDQFGWEPVQVLPLSEAERRYRPGAQNLVLEHAASIAATVPGLAEMLALEQL